MNSRTKGKVGEREAAAALTAHLGVKARRGVQYQGGIDSPDLHTSLPGVHWEVKRVERLNLTAAMEQAKADAGESVPVVLSRRNRGEWIVSVPLARLVELVGRIAAVAAERTEQ